MRRRRGGRWAGPPIAALALVFALAGCGFHPLYGPRKTSRTAAAIATIQIDRIKDRKGQVLRNFLLDRLNPLGAPRRPRYVLKVTLTESRQELGIRKDETATRANLRTVATFQRLRPGVKKPLFKGHSESTNSFNIVDSDFATLVAEADARKRAARRLSDEIATRLALYFDRTGTRRDGGGS